jgi:PAS domain S-box-containing protein
MNDHGIMPGAKPPALARRAGRRRRLPFEDNSAAAFAVAALLVLATLLVHWAIASHDLNFPPFVLLFPAIALSGWFCGGAAGALAILMSVASAAFLWPPWARPPIMLPNLDPVSVAVFAVAAGVILCCVLFLRGMAARAESARTTLDAALANGNVGAWEIDLNTMMIEASRSTHELLGMPYGQRARGLADWLAKIVPDDAGRLRRLVTEAAETGRGISTEFHLPMPDGATRSVAIRGEVVGLEGRRRLVGALIDMTDRARAEALQRMHERQGRERDAKFRVVAEVLPGLVFVTDANGRNTYTNSHFTAYAGVDAAAMLGDGWISVIHPDDVPGVMTQWQATVASGAPYDYEFRMRARDGSYRWFLCRGMPIRDAEGRIVEWCGIGLDIEDRKRAEAALADREERLRLAVEAGSLATFEVDLDTRKRHWEPAMAALFGLAPETMDLDATTITDFFHPDDREFGVTYFEEATRTGRMDTEFRIVTVSGETKWVVSRGLVITGADGRRRMIGALRDVTEQRRREDALREALAAREIVVREADHRIKNSLQLVVGLLRMQRRRVSDPEASEALDSAAARVEAVAQSHLALQQSSDLKTVDLGSALRDLCTQLGPLNPDVRIECDLAGDLALDAERAIPLALIVNELLTNALRHAYPGGGGSVSVGVALSERVVTVSVADAGVGYAPGEVGSGLGSTVIQTLSRQIGAEVETRSVPGGGTRTLLTLAR